MAAFLQQVSQEQVELNEGLWLLVEGREKYNLSLQGGGKKPVFCTLRGTREIKQAQQQVRLIWNKRSLAFRAIQVEDLKKESRIQG